MLRYDRGKRGELVLVEPVEVRREHEERRSRGYPRASASANRRRAPGVSPWLPRTPRTGTPIDSPRRAQCRRRRPRIPTSGNPSSRTRGERRVSRSGAPIGGCDRNRSAAVDAITRQHQKQQDQDPLVAGDLAPRDEIDREQGETGIDGREQIERPIDRRRQREPGAAISAASGAAS